MRWSALCLAASIVFAQTPADPPDALDLGRMRYTLTAGILLSNDQGFSATQAAMYLSLNADRAWRVAPIGINTFFEARLTSVPVQSTLDTFLQSQKAAGLLSGIYLPITTTRWTSGTTSYSFYIAPLAEIGFVTLTEPSPGITGRFFTYYSYGARLGMSSISYVDITTGRFGNFEAYNSSMIVRPWRYSFEGLFKIPHSVFVVGFNANLGRGSVPFLTQPPDDLRFLFGARLDFAKFLKSLPTF